MGSSPLSPALEALARGLTGLPYMVIGGMAVVARGVARTTRDIDATIPGSQELGPVLTRLATAGIVSRVPDVEAFARQTQVLLLRHSASGVEIDLALAWMQFELDAIRAAEMVDLGGTPMRVATAEDLVVYKVVGWRPVDQQDIRELLALHGTSVDLTRIRALVREVAEAVEDPDRIGAFEAIVRRSLRNG